MTLAVLDFCGFILPSLAASRLTGAGRSQNGQGPRPAAWEGASRQAWAYWRYLNSFRPRFSGAMERRAGSARPVCAQFLTF